MRRKFTNEEDEFILNNFHNMNASIISKKLKRGSSSIYNRINKLRKLHPDKLKTKIVKQDNFLGNASYKRIWYQYLRDCKRRNLEWMLTFDEFKTLLEGNCYYCNIEPIPWNVYLLTPDLKKKGVTVSFETANKYWINANGIDRIDSSKHYIQDNCVSCCNLCNIMKWDYPVETFITHIKKIVDNLNLK